MTYTVNSASYTTGPGELNPLVMIQGKLNGVYVNCRLFWAAIQQANNYNGVLAVRDLIAIGFQNFQRGFSPALSSPVIPASEVPAPVSPATNQVCSEGLVGTW